jgi:hypothetical protein
MHEGIVFTDREILEAIAAAIALLFILLGWSFKDNRNSHRALWREIADAKMVVVNCILGKDRGGQ